MNFFFKLFIICAFSTASWANTKDNKNRCAQGDANACYNVGEAYLYGRSGVHKNMDLAKAFIKLSCEAEVQEACDELKKIEKDRVEETRKQAKLDKQKASKKRATEAKRLQKEILDLKNENEELIKETQGLEELEKLFQK